LYSMAVAGEAILDKRWHRRAALAIDVLVYCDGFFVGRGQTENLGPGGAYVRLNGLTLMPDSFLEVEFCVPQDSARDIFRFPARVVHSTRRGAGLLFEDFDRVLLEVAFAES